MELRVLGVSLAMAALLTTFSALIFDVVYVPRHAVSNLFSITKLYTKCNGMASKSKKNPASLVLEQSEMKASLLF